MFKTIQRLFSKNESNSQKSETPAVIDIERPIEEYFHDEVTNSVYFKPDYRQRVLDHLLHKQSLNKTGNNLTVEEKKSLGINTRLSITKELVQVLSREGISLENPKALLEEIYYRATISKSRIDGFHKARKIGIKKFTLLTSGDGSECEWCRNNADHEFGHDILEQMRINCKCKPYSKCIINSVVDFE